MKKRTIKFLGTSGIEFNKPIYNTANNWTLVEYSLSAPVRKTNVIAIPGRDGELDIAPALGDVTYEPRELRVILECSDGTRESRTNLINDITNMLTGRYCRIITPDDPEHFLQGYIDIEQDYNDTDHSRIIITSRVDPWRICINSIRYTLECSATQQKVIIKNKGGKKVVPLLSAWTEDGTQPNITVKCGAIYTHTFDTFGTDKPENLAMRYKDEFALTYYGSGYLEIMWQEASL